MKSTIRTVIINPVYSRNTSLLVRSIKVTSLLLCLLISACVSNRFSEIEGGDTVTIGSDLLLPLFKNSSPSPLYKAEISLYRKKFGGLLLVKNMPDSSYRVVFTTETGIKLLDFELKKSGYKLLYCIDKLNRPSVVSTIAADIQLLLTEFKQAQSALLVDQNGNRLIQLNQADTITQYLLEPQSNLPKKIEQGIGKKKKVVLDLHNYVNEIPSGISIQHKNIRLKIILTLVER
ncbi:MAG: hypothetical protein IPP56_08780 [Bacteroidetes bacterium]|nr:hypothetical protein [Bacteroidota bacterium]